MEKIAISAEVRGSPGDDDRRNELRSDKNDMQSLKDMVYSMSKSKSLVSGRAYRRPRSVILWACNECKRRKSKCVGSPICDYCSKTNRLCVYDTRPSRLPLTRKNIDFLQKRCRDLERTLEKLHPNTDINKLVDSGGAVNHIDEINIKDASGDDGYDHQDSISSEYTDIPDPDELEWHEPSDVGVFVNDACTDGTGSLQVTPQDSGYLGQSSGATLLRMVQGLVDDRYNNQRKKPNFNALKSSNTVSSSAINTSLLQDEKALTSSVVSDILVDLYFAVYHPSFPLLHEPTFRAQYSNNDLIHEKPDWQLLLRMVLALGAFAGSTKPNNDDYAFYVSARMRFSAELFESGTVERVQMLLLVANYLQKRDRPNTSYNILGLAVRMAMGMGLHRELEPQKQNSTSTTLKMEARRRIWWILYMFESGASITFGRPSMVSDQMVDVRLPKNIDDCNVLSHGSTPKIVQYATPYTASIAQARLSIIANRLYNSFFALHQPAASEVALAQLVCSFEEQLSKWRSSLPKDFFSIDAPEWFKGPRAIVLWKEQNLRMLMYKSILKYGVNQKGNISRPDDPGMLSNQDSYSNSNLQRCMEIAQETVEAVESYCSESNRVTRGVAWYATYFLFQAVLLLLFTVLHRNENVLITENCRKSFETGKQRLRKLESINLIAVKYLATLEETERKYNEKRSTTAYGDDMRSADSQRLERAIDEQLPANGDSASIISSSEAHSIDKIEQSVNNSGYPSIGIINMEAVDDSRVINFYNETEVSPSGADKDAVQGFFLGNLNEDGSTLWPQQYECNTDLTSNFDIDGSNMNGFYF
ncbi:fungal-specific transcription factor domain-containing protein [Dipodascopsis uninucleata]